MPWPAGKYAEDEIRKRLAALIESGESCVLIDNVQNGSTIESSALDTLLTSDEFYDRKLGESSMIGGPNHLMCMFTGNGVRPSEDSSQRFLIIELDAPEGNRRSVDPSKEFADTGEIGDFVRNHRRELLEALLTILRAYRKAGRPKMEGQHWGTFQHWKNECVDPIHWATGVDPLAGIADDWVSESNAGNGLLQFASAWLRDFPGRRLSARDLKTICTAPGYNDDRDASLAYSQDMADATSALLGGDDIANIGPMPLAKRLRAYAGTPATPDKPKKRGTYIKISEDIKLCLMYSLDRTKTGIFSLQDWS